MAITLHEIVGSLLAVVAFAPAMLCSHNMAAVRADLGLNEPYGWVWTLTTVIADPDFRALECSR